MSPLYCRRANAIIVMTETAKRNLKKYLNVSDYKIKVIYASHHERFEAVKDKKELLAIKQKYNLPENYLFFIGGITPLKNFSNIIKAFKIIKDKIPVKLVMVGFKRWKYTRDFELIKKLNLQNDVITMGLVQDGDLPYIYNSAQCLVFPSLYEGFGIPILEAQACGCPVITSKKGCTPEVSGGTALLVNPYNYKEIAEGIYNVLNNRDLRERLIEAGLENEKKLRGSK